MADNKDCPSCQDLPGSPVPGQEDVYAFAMPVPPDDQLTPWHAMQSAKPLAAAWGNSPAAQSPWPKGLFDYDATPEPGQAAAAKARVEYLPPLNAPSHQWPVQQQALQPDPMAGVIQDAHDPSVTYLPPLGAPWVAQGHDGVSSDPMFQDKAPDADPQAEYPDKAYPKWIRDLLEKGFPGQPNEIKGDSDGAVRVRLKGGENETVVKRRKDSGEPNPRRQCGGAVTYYIALTELIPSDPLEEDAAKAARRRRIYDWAYALKAKDAEAALSCKRELCEENEAWTKCVIERGASLGNWGDRTDRDGEVIPRVGYVSVTYRCRCEAPPDRPITGPKD